MTPFVHLHVHSDFSLQDAAVSAAALADKAEALGMRHLALTDHGNMFGAMEFVAACEESVTGKGKHERRANPVTPVIGCEVYVAPGSRHEKHGAESENKYFHLVLLAENREGYRNLVKLCSFAYTEGFYYKPRVDEELLEKYHSGLIALSACVSGEIPRLIQAGKLDEAERRALRYRGLFGEDNFYLEIQDHGIPAEILKGNLSQREIYDAIINISRKTGIPLVATNDVHYLNREDSVAHDILLCIGTGKTRTEEKRKKYYGDQFYFKSGDEMAALFPEHPEALANTVKIAERCAAGFMTEVKDEKTGETRLEYRFPKVKVKDLTKYLPDFEIPSGFDSADGYLRHLTMEGLKKRYPEMREDIVKRAEYELDVIIKMGFTGYFLIVADFINWAKERGIPVGPGRGSGAGSLVAYAIRVTDIDPLKYNLLFERFLNPERVSMPDFDVDFANEGRDDVIRYVTEKYGKERVGQIITFGTLGAKQVIKDVARALGVSIPESDMITKLIPRDPKITLEKALEGEAKLRDLERDPRYTELFSLARKLEGLNRHSSLHAAGVVIGKSALDDFVPLYKDPKTGGIATQYSMNFLESCGLVKMDFLGLKTLDVIKKTCELIREKGGEFAGFDINAVDEHDEAVFKMLGEGNSYEVFQFESEGMRNTLKQAKPTCIEDLIALNALYRPGPMDNIAQFIECKNGRRKIEYPDPSLEAALKETYGVIVYQEQVMEVARIIAGYSMGQADLLRRAMGKKKKEIIDKEKKNFLAGAVKQGYSEAAASRIYDILVPFAGYGFNKSHAAAYSVLAYQTAYLKAHFPAEFMAASLSNEIHSADKDRLSECIDEARKMGIAIDPPDINRSAPLFTVVDDRIVFGFLGIKGVGESPAEEIVRCRKEGPYQDFMDFLKRTDIGSVPKAVVERLIQTGAFDTFGVSRETLRGNLDRVVEYVKSIKEEKSSGQVSLFGESGEKEFADFVFEPFPEQGRADKLKDEKELIGFYFSGHPLDDYKELWQKVVKVDLGKRDELPTGGCVLLGLVKTVKSIVTRGGKMAFATIADYNGEIEATFFADAWGKCQDKIAADKVAILRGKIDYQKDKDKWSFLAEECLSREEALTAAETETDFLKQMDEYRAVWEGEVRVNLAKPEQADPREDYTLVGVLRDLKPRRTQKGDDMANASLADYRGEISVTIFPKAWGELRGKLEEGKPAALRGKIKEDSFKKRPVFYAESALSLLRLKSKYANGGAAASNAVSVTPAVSGAAPFPAAPAAARRELHLRLRDAGQEGDLVLLRDFLLENSGSCPVFLHIPSGPGETVVKAAAQLYAGSAPEVLKGASQCAAVAEAWGQ
ncbi:MAG: DNA polymerase III subunit alpha [Treponematales bacterium]